MIPESHLASIGEVVSLHDGVLSDRRRRAGEGYGATSQRLLVTAVFYQFNIPLEIIKRRKSRQPLRTFLRRDKISDACQCY